MAKCPKCNADLEEGAKFCSACGEKLVTEQTPAQEAAAPQSAASSQYSADAADLTAQFDPKDIADNKIMAVLSYISWLVLIPILAAPKSNFARFHANQGLILFIAGFFGVIPVIGTIISFVAFIFAIMGIVYAAQGKAKELPFINKIKILK